MVKKVKKEGVTSIIVEGDDALIVINLLVRNQFATLEYTSTIVDILIVLDSFFLKGLTCIEIIN